MIRENSNNDTRVHRVYIYIYSIYTVSKKIDVAGKKSWPLILRFEYSWKRFSFFAHRARPRATKTSRRPGVAGWKGEEGNKKEGGT